jgi:hypothetical protein
LGQRCQWIIEQGYELSETPYQQYLDYVGDMQYDYTEYQEPADWTTFSTRLHAAMDTVPEHVNIYFVYDDSLVHGEILYFRVDTTLVHELISYWID